MSADFSYTLRSCVFSCYTGFIPERLGMGDQYLSDFNLTFFSDSFDRGSHLFSGLIQFIYTCRFYFTRKPFRISMRKDRKQVTF